MDIWAGVLAPSFLFVFFALLVNVGLAPAVRFLERELGARSPAEFDPGSPDFDEQKHAVLVVAAARSLTCCTACLYALYRFLAHDEALTLVASWATVMIIFNLSVHRIRGSDNAYMLATGFFVAMVASVFMEHSVFLLFLALLATGTTVRGLDFLNFALNHL